MDRITVESNRFVDEYGRERIFYGINLGGKNFPPSHWRDKNSQVNPLEEHIKYLSAHGINVIRYFVNWSYIEPRPKQYSEYVLNEIQEFLDICEKNNVFVYLDMHQDLYGAFTAQDSKRGTESHGDGAPPWAFITNGKKYRKPVFVWAEGYFINKAVQNAFDHFWNNTAVEGQGLQDHFCDLWRMLAKRFSSHPAFLGFDIFNEPYPGTDGGKVFFSIVKSAIKTTLTNRNINKKRLVSALFRKDPIPNILKQYDSKIIDQITASGRKYIEKFDREKYSPFINKVAAAIREETQNGIILMENSYYSNLGIPFSAPPITVNSKHEKNQAFAPHAYDLMVDTPMYKFADNERVGAIFKRRRTEQEKHLNMPVIVGEWGGFDVMNEDTAHAEYLLNLFDSYKWSHTYWLFDASIMDSPLMNTLCRPHPIAVCGEIEKYSFDKAAQLFTLSFHQEKDYTVPTEIFCHKPPAEIETDGEYEIKQLDHCCCILKIFTKPGKNKITIKYKEV